MEEEIFNPFGLNNTFLLEDSLQLAGKGINMALPYILDDGIQPGFIDYGYSSSAGIVSTAGDLVRFSHALDENLIITADSKEIMHHGLQNNLPYAYGLFIQNIQGLDIIWAFGQYDCYSSLLMKIPAKDLTLVLLANNNLMSDPARLIMGDVTSSLFAISFLKNFVFDLSEMILIEQPESIYEADNENNIYMKKILAQAVAESFMVQHETQKMEISTHLIEQTFINHTDYLSYGDINLLHTLCFLKDAAFHMDLGTFNQFDKHIEAIGMKLLERSPNNPYVHSYMGTYYDRLGDNEKASGHYKAIVNLNNFSQNWYTREAMVWLNENE